MQKSFAIGLAIIFSCHLSFAQTPAVPVSINVPYVQYLKLKLDPADLSNNTELVVQNTDKVIDLKYREGTSVTISRLDFRGDSDIAVSVSESRANAAPAIALPLKITVNKATVVQVKLTPKPKKKNVPPVADAGVDQVIDLPETSASLDGSHSIGSTGTITGYKWTQTAGPSRCVIADASSAKTQVSGLKPGDYKFSLTITNSEGGTDTDEVLLTVKPAETFDFKLSGPANGSMETTARRPTLTWEAFPKATNYDIYMNISRGDYDWYAPGNLLDRYTKVGESSTNSFTLAGDLPDRWTYKWYVVASTPSGAKQSDKRQFGLYIPAMPTEDDGIKIVNGCRDLNKNGTIEPYEDWHLTPEARLDDLMKRMTTEEKAQQLFYGATEKNAVDGFSFSYGVEHGMRAVQFAAAKTRMGIPVAFMGDKIHGWKTIYPTQLGLAATRDMNLVYQCGNLHRLEEKGFGFTGTLCPLAEVDTKVLYPRFQEGCGENAEDAAAMLRAILCGMQGGPELNPHSMLVTVKHWPSQGAGGESALQYDAVTIKYHMKPWVAAFEANAASVMPGYNRCPFLDPSNGANSSRRVNRYLRNDMKFKGFVVTDWLAATTAQSVESLGAGIDVMGGVPSSNTDMNQLVDAIGIDRINESARRVLDAKIRMGMLDDPYSDPTCKWDKDKHHAIVLEAAKKSITLLKNNGVLPPKLKAGDEVVVAGPRATWPQKINDPNVIWQSIYYEDKQALTYVQAITERGATDGLKVSQDTSPNPKVAVVVIGEKSYTHGTDWPDKNPNIPDDQLSIIKGFHDKGVKVITVIISPRPYVLTPLLDISDAIMLVYRGGTGIGQATAGCIFGDFAPSGKLPFQLPRSADQIGTDNVKDMREHWDLPYDLGATDDERAKIRSDIEKGQPIPPAFGDPLFQYGAGLQGFGPGDATKTSAPNK